MKILYFIIIPAVALSQGKTDIELDSAYLYAKKGMYWALSNYDSAKSRIDKELITGSRLVSSVKVLRQVDGIKIESKGFYNSTEITLKIYKSDEFLREEGYMKTKENLLSDKKKRKKQD